MTKPTPPCGGTNRTTTIEAPDMCAAIFSDPRDVTGGERPVRETDR